MKGEQLSKELHVKMKLLLDWTAVPAASYIHLVQLVTTQVIAEGPNVGATF